MRIRHSVLALLTVLYFAQAAQAQLTQVTIDSITLETDKKNNSDIKVQGSVYIDAKNKAYGGLTFKVLDPNGGVMIIVQTGGGKVVVGDQGDVYWFRTATLSVRGVYQIYVTMSWTDGAGQPQKQTKTGSIQY